jgi:hypothetical protein
MEITIDIPDDQAAEIAAQAGAQGLSLDRYLVEMLVGSRPTVSDRRHTVADAIDSIRALRKGNRLDGLAIGDLVNEGRRF